MDARRARQELDHIRDQVNIVQRQLEDATVGLKRTRQQHLLATQELQQVKRETEEERGRLETAKVQSWLAVDEASNLRIRSGRYMDQHRGGGSSRGSPGSFGSGHEEVEMEAVGARNIKLRATLQDLEARVVELTREHDAKVRCRRSRVPHTAGGHLVGFLPGGDFGQPHVSVVARSAWLGVGVRVYVDHALCRWMR